ncbi:MAG: acyl-CoA synthetase [Bacteroidales bacterium]
MSQLALFERAVSHGDRTAIVAGTVEATYRQLFDDARAVAGQLLSRDVRSGDRVAYLVAPGIAHVAVQWGIWMAGGIGVPLGSAQVAAEWAYAIADSDAAVVVADEDCSGALASAVPQRAHWVVRRDHLLRVDEGHTGVPGASAPALILYTSGTTGKPKGVVLTHATIEAQVRCLVEAWEWQPRDRILHVLPLNHVHGIVNVLTCALWSGATCELAPKFDAGAAWEALSAGRLTLFMAVPTIYTKLVAAWDAMPPGGRAQASAGCRALRLMVSGSAALPVSTLQRWREISGHVLLERYGMTEIGMALSNPLHGERRPGSVGVPLPGVDVRIVDEKGREVAPGEPGELEVKGPGVFREYWRRPEATQSAFQDGWFRTGDVAVFERGMFRLLGRQSVDIIKSGGYKISALEIEEVLRDHPAVRECAVVGVEDAEWGEQVAVAAVLHGQTRLEFDELRDWARTRLARYKLPSRLVVVEELPRNAMGKVSKPDVKRLFGS